MKELPLAKVVVSDRVSQEAAILHHVATSTKAAKSGQEFDNLRHREAVKAALLKLDLVLEDLGHPEVVGLTPKDRYFQGRATLTTGSKRLSLDTIPVKSFSQEQIPDSVLDSLREGKSRNLFSHFRVAAFSESIFSGPPSWEEGEIGCATADRYLIGVIRKIGRKNTPIASIFEADENPPEFYFGWSSSSDYFDLDHPRFFLVDQWQVKPQ